MANQDTNSPETPAAPTADETTSRNENDESTSSRRSRRNARRRRAAAAAAAAAATAAAATGQSQNNNNTDNNNKTKFTGSTSQMNGHVFQCNSETEKRNQFNRTKEELCAYAKKTLAFPQDISYVIKNMENINIKDKMPKDIDDKASKADRYNGKRTWISILTERIHSWTT
jgi:uncharacterized protein HemX